MRFKERFYKIINFKNLPFECSFRPDKALLNWEGQKFYFKIENVEFHYLIRNVVLPPLFISEFNIKSPIPWRTEINIIEKPENPK